MVMGRLYNPQRPGGHSVAAYGEAFGIKKDDELDDFSQWSERLETRCVDDTLTTAKTYKELVSRGVEGWGPVRDWTDDMAMSVWIEHRFAEIIAMQMENGVSLDERGAIEVAAECDVERQKLVVELQKAFPPWLVSETKHGQPLVFTPKKDLKSRNYSAGASFTKLKIEEFNPDSGQQVAARLIAKYQWVPTKFTDGGEPATDEEVMKNLEYPEAKLLARWARVDKMWKQIAAPKKADGSGGGWLHHIDPDTGRVHGYVNSCGAVTGRCTHSRPNTANVDKKDLRLRAIWTPRDGWTFMGSDGSSLELCMMSHYLAPYDGGEYGVMVTQGDKAKGTDSHTKTIRILGMVKRDNGKRVIYAMIYGAGDAKLGLIVIEDALEADVYNPEKMPHLFIEKKGKLKKRAPSDLGKEARDKLETGIVGLKELKRAVSDKVRTQGHIRGLDGRVIRIRSQHSALNALFQGAGAIVMKLAAVLFYLKLCREGLVHGRDYGFCLNVHDEVQVEWPTREQAVKYGKLFVECITEAGLKLGVRCPLSGTADVGANWAETH